MLNHVLSHSVTDRPVSDYYTVTQETDKLEYHSYVSLSNTDRGPWSARKLVESYMKLFTLHYLQSASVTCTHCSHTPLTVYLYHYMFCSLYTNHVSAPLDWIHQISKIFTQNCVLRVDEKDLFLHTLRGVDSFIRPQIKLNRSVFFGNSGYIGFFSSYPYHPCISKTVQHDKCRLWVQGMKCIWRRWLIRRWSNNKSNCPSVQMINLVIDVQKEG